MTYPLNIKNNAVSLRKNGYSLNEISHKLRVAKSTLSAWFPDVTLDQAAQKRLQKRWKSGTMKSIETRRKKQLKLTIQYKQTAQNGLKEIELNSSLKKLICSLLFWCEGAKQRDRVQFINSDPILVKIFVSLLRESYELDEKKFRVLMHLHDYHDEERQKNFWSNATGIPPTQFTKTYWKKNTGKRRREQYPGCIRVSYYDAEIAQQLYAWYNVLAKVIGSDI